MNAKTNFELDTTDTLLKPSINKDTANGEDDETGDENKERGNWSGKLDFILTAMGYSIGLGNLWRFPYLCYRNGGGAFLIPFTIMMFLVGFPTAYMNIVLGQFSSSSPLTVWKCSPLFKGLGVGMFAIGVISRGYYNMILSYAQYYVAASFTSELPWLTCNNTWNTERCTLSVPVGPNGNGTLYANDTVYHMNISSERIMNISVLDNKTSIGISSSEEYWNNYVLGLGESITDMGSPKWQLVLSLFIAWVITYVCLIKGIKSAGKVVYLTATFPCLLLVILLVRGLMLPNSDDGIYFFLIPKWEKLADIRVWKDATVQVVYSVTGGTGGLIALASYNRFHNNAFRDSVLLTLGDYFISILAGLVIFSYLGYMAGYLGVHIEDVATQGAGLVYVVYPQAIGSLPFPPVWSVLFFVMMVFLGLDTQFGEMEALMTSLYDQFPSLKSKKTFLFPGICVVFFLTGIPLAATNGMYIVHLLDNYVSGWAVFLIMIAQILVISYIYGIDRFMKDIQIMTGQKPTVVLKIVWTVIVPLSILFILIFSLVDYAPLKYGTAYDYPVWADAVGWMISISPILVIPLVMVYKVYKIKDATIYQALRRLSKPAYDWGPALVKHRKLIDYVPGFLINPMKREIEIANTKDQNCMNML